MTPLSSSSATTSYLFPPIVAPEFDPPHIHRSVRRTFLDASARNSDAAADLCSATPSLIGFGLPLKVQLNYFSRWLLDGAPASCEFGCGTSWLCSLTPYLAEEGAVAGVVFSPDVAYWFDRVGGEYRGRFGAKQRLTHDPAARCFTLAMPDGTLWKFCDSAWIGLQRGAFRSLTTPEGNTVEVTDYTPLGQVKTIAWGFTRGEGSEPVSTTERLRLDYLPPGPDRVERIGKISWTTQIDNGAETLLREQRHTYYGAGESHGNAGDLKTVTLLEPDGSQMSVIETRYMRYYTSSARGIGFQHGLRYYLGATAVERLKQDPQFTNLDSATAGLLSRYADAYFEYRAGSESRDRS